MADTDFASWPDFDAEQVTAAADVLASGRVNYWTGGEGRAFEREFAHYSDCAHAIALANGTVALDLALHGLGIGARNGGSEHDEVIVTPRSFIASVSSVVNAGARPVFADIDRDSGNIEPATIEPHITQATRGVVPVHLAGWPVDMPTLMDLASSRDVAVIEDCAQAHGATIDGRSVGSFGDAAGWSFCQDKIMTTGGEGGMVTCQDDALHRAMWAHKDHGKGFAAVYEREHPPGFRWLHESFGTNWRMLEMQAAIGRIQLARMDRWTAARNANAARMVEALGEAVEAKALRVPRPRSGMRHADYKFYAYVEPERLRDGWSRDRIVAEITERGIPCFQGSCSEIYREKAFEGTDYAPAEALPVARELGETSLMWLVHPTITASQIDRAAQVTRDVMASAIQS
ncbi:DegT/DnrJ/EryC1/StrS aminotransferase family protein [Sphingomicrobium sp. XHP0239]|uniref:DegT/DnrJ/EryC1/StrS family aminotransferase n=1 Tax=Sphingomicrobium maritimum TaxID=3133972 RepID=UPI0031CCA5B3